MVHAAEEKDSALALWWRGTIQCRACPTLAPWRKFAASSHGCARSGMMILGEAPGRVSLEQARGFSNPRNLTIRQAFARAVAPRHYELEEVVYLTDAVKCWPSSASGANRSPTSLELRTCIKRHLDAEIALVKPRVILAFGRHSAAAALGHDVQLSLVHGKVHRNLKGIRVIPLMHPSTANLAGMRRAGIRCLMQYELWLAKLIRSELANLIRGDR
jgi:uracil-DNA glycosylase family 4